MEHGPAKQSIIEFVRATTTKGSPNFVPPPERIAEFDQDGALWVEHPVYTQIIYCLDRVPTLVNEKPELKDREPFRAVPSGNRETIAHLSIKKLFEIVIATQSGMTVEEFRDDVKGDWPQLSIPLGPALHRTRLSADVGSAALLACQGLQNLHCDRR